MVDAILQAAARVFDREGMQATTNRIAVDAGVSIGSLYQYFPNKEALLFALAERHLAQAWQALRQTSVALDAAVNVREIVQGYVHAMVDLHREHPRMHLVLDELAVTTAGTPAHAEIMAGVHELLAWLGEELVRHLRRVRPELDDPSRRAKLVVGTIFEALHRTVVGVEGDPAYVPELVRLYGSYLEA